MRSVRAIGLCASLAVAGFLFTYAVAEPSPLRLAQTSPAEKQPPSAGEFQRLYAYISNTGDDQTIPEQVAQRLGMSGAKPIRTWRRGFAQRRTRDWALLRQYAVDIPQSKLVRPFVLITQIIPGDPAGDVPADTTVVFLFDENGRIIRTLEIFPKRNHAIEEIRDGAYDPLGYDIWVFVLGRVDKPS